MGPAPRFILGPTLLEVKIPLQQQGQVIRVEVSIATYAWSLHKIRW
jgi:hypothetical protein